MYLDATQAGLVTLALVQVCGLAVTFAARIAEGHARQGVWHRTYLAALLVSGLSTLAAALLGPGTCVVCGACLAIMVLGATWDPRLDRARA